MFQENNSRHPDVLIPEVFDYLADDIGFDRQDLITITQKLNVDALNHLIEIGWDANEIKDLLVVIFNASDETRVGVFGSMSRGKPGFVSTLTEELVDGDSDIDTLIEPRQSYPENVTITEHHGKFSERRINVFTIKKEYAEPILGDNYASVIWIYDNPDQEQIDRSDAAIYEFMYGI